MAYYGTSIPTGSAGQIDRNHAKLFIGCLLSDPEYQPDTKKGYYAILSIIR